MAGSPVPMQLGQVWIHLIDRAEQTQRVVIPPQGSGEVLVLKVVTCIVRSKL